MVSNLLLVDAPALKDTVDGQAAYDALLDLYSRVALKRPDDELRELVDYSLRVLG